MECRVAIISGIISVVVAVITSYISVKLTYSNEIQKNVYSEKENLYVEIFELIEQLQLNPYLVYSTEKFIQHLRLIKVKTNLYASREVLDILVPFYSKVMSIWSKYTDLYTSENAEKILQGRKFSADESGLEDERIELEFQQESELFMENNLIETEEITNFLNNLAIQIRSELKTE